MVSPDGYGANRGRTQVLVARGNDRYFSPFPTLSYNPAIGRLPDVRQDVGDALAHGRLRLVSSGLPKPPGDRLRGCLLPQRNLFRPRAGLDREIRSRARSEGGA